MRLSISKVLVDPASNARHKSIWNLYSGHYKIIFDYALNKHSDSNSFHLRFLYQEIELFINANCHFSSVTRHRRVKNRLGTWSSYKII